MNPLKKLGTKWRTFVDPLPYTEFANYDDYWGLRSEEVVLHRWEIAAKYIPAGSSVLDVGCGQGGFLAYLRGVRDGVDIEGTDISPEAVKLTQDRGISAFHADLSTSALEAQYDVITAFEVLEHIPDAETVLMTLRDATRKFLIVSIPNIGFIDHRIRLAIFGRFPNTSLKFHAKEHLRHWTPWDFRYWARRLGLEIVAIHGQYGSRYLPWESHPKLFSPQVVYILRRAAE